MESSPKKIIPPESLLSGYARGIFAMSESRDDPGYQWYTAHRRGIIPLDRFRVSGNVKRLIRQNRFELQINRRFREVVRECANRSTTWISDIIIDSFELLHELGYAHSVEMIDGEGRLAGGLYGVALGGAFFGESMFRNKPEADKAALWHCHNVLYRNGFELWDAQYYTGHLAQFGCIEIPSEEYRTLLETALEKEAVFAAPPASGPAAST